MAKSRTAAERPKLSVVMPVHNALPFLDEAVESILGQSFRDFEFVILDDASNDGSTERLREWAARDKHIRLIISNRNLGPALSSQRVASAASAPIVARMDADDISYPERLRKQFEILRDNPEAGLVACLCDIIDTKGTKLRGPDPWRLVRKSLMAPFAHGAMMYRRDLFERIGGYRMQCDYWEDQDLVMRMAAESGILVIPEALFAVRHTSTSTRVASDQEKLEDAVNRMYGCLARLREGREYDDLLPGNRDRSDKIDPRVFLSLGSATLWAGGRPRLFGRFLKRARLRPNLMTATTMVWTAWAALGPATLRAFLRLLLKLRNRAARVPTEAPVRWAPALAADDRELKTPA